MRDRMADYIEALPIDPEEKRRIKMTAGCTDSRPIPKVARAGQTFQGPDGRHQLMHNGVKVIADCYYGRWMTELIRLLKGHHEPQEEEAFHEVLQHVPGRAVMVELGASGPTTRCGFTAGSAGPGTTSSSPTRITWRSAGGTSPSTGPRGGSSTTASAAGRAPPRRSAVRAITCSGTSPK
jgi:hypothetical protein